VIAVTLLLAAFAVTTCVHELGHYAVARALGLPARPTLTRYGPATLIGRDDLILTRWQVRLTSAGGPAANAAAAYAVCVPLHLGALALLNLLFAAVNLLPIPRSDGTRILAPGRALRLARDRPVEQAVRKSGGYQPRYAGPPPPPPPPKREDAYASAAPPRRPSIPLRS
jgi:hypothetical protein